MARTELQVNQFPSLLGDLRQNYRSEIIGLVVFGLGIVVLLSLRTDAGTPWLVRAAGWTAPLIVVTILIVGAALIMRPRVGYWSAEALVGAEMLLLALAAGTFVLNNETFEWVIRADGTNGGVLGWTLGGILTEAVGHTPALAITLTMGVVGLYLVVRYSPLIYGVVYTVRLWPIIPIYWRWFIDERLGLRRKQSGADTFSMPVYAGNFVTPYDVSFDIDDDASGIVVASLAERTEKRNQKSKRSINTRTLGTKQVKLKHELPPIDMLYADDGVYGGSDVAVLEHTIERTLEDFDVPVRVVHVESGPTVTQFGVEPLYLEKSGGRRKVRVNRIASLADDLALALAAKSVRIEAPVPGRPYVGIEVPNINKASVSLRGILESSAMEKADAQLMMGLGRDTAGAPVVMDLTKAPHMLIAGATGSGKSVCINSILTSLLMQHGPESLQLVLVDPKMVELPGYNGIPHLIGKVITDVEQVMGALTWLLLQMDDRYQMFREVGARNITAYNEMILNQKRGRNELKPLPYIVLVVDELADLMMTAAEDVERQICRLAQMSRATGIHLILATQRPSTDVVTGVIKANFPSRIAFAVTSQVDSRVILDHQGAERLLGQGDMLFMRPDAAKLYRVQGCYVSDDEIDKVVAFWRTHGEQKETVVPPWNGLMDRVDDEDELVLDAIDLLRGMKSCSTSMLQRKLRLGYPKAARLMEQLEQKRVVGPDQGGGQGREVLLKDEEKDEDEVEDLF